MSGEAAAKAASEERSAKPPQVSVVILNWNKSEMTLDCVRRVVEHTADIAHEIIVVDNGSRAEEVDRLAAGLHPSATLLQLNENLYFGEANNVGVEAARGEFVLLLNNDAHVAAGYLAPLIRAFAEEFSVGAVAPRFVFPDGSLQEAGCFILPDGLTFQHGKYGMKIAKRFERGCHVVDYCSAACLLLRRDVYLTFGGFDPLFDPAYFEDADLALRLRSKGLYTYYCADAQVCHLENVTSHAIWSKDELSGVAGANGSKFFARWRDYLGNRLSCDAEPAPLEDLIVLQQTDERRPTLFLCTSGRMEISDECRSMFSLAATLQDEYEIVFAAREACSQSRLRWLCHHFGVPLKGASVRRFSEAVLSEEGQVVLFGELSVADLTATNVYLATAANLIECLRARVQAN